MRLLVIALIALSFLNNSGFSAETLPTCPPDWKVEVIAEAPQLIHPSAVCVAPDGRVFVGQDPMDMGLASDKPADYILCFHPDGKVNVFATNLYAVYGLSYLDGKLYVHNCPKLTVFRDDDSVGKDREDLFQTNPRPWQGGFNDHIPANLHYAMDGYFYLATGDKGISGAVGRDGSKVDLEGGGVIRFRPDGTHLEIYSSGTRNHLDVAINDEMEMFTYDNTDDGNGWWTRVTHMVERGWYGYPHDYKPQRPYTLWMMKDYGGGSPTGAIAYNEDALPGEYHGNLFMSEWGKGELARFVVEREGATYKIVSRQAFLKLRGAEFRPVGVDVSADGLSLYVADWNYGGWKNKMVVGRFLKVTYTGKSQGVPKPDWFVPAALGKEVPAVPVDELIAALRHPSERVRLVAQRLLTRSGQPGVRALRRVVADSKFPALGRAHAIWALDAMDRAGRSETLSATTAADPVVRRQAARQLGSFRDAGVFRALADRLQDDDRSVRFQAATALGKNGNPAAVPELLRALDDDDLFARYAAFTALNAIGRHEPKAWRLIARGLENDVTRIRENTLFAMRETYDLGNVQALSGFIENSRASAEMRAAALGILAELHRQRIPWKGGWWGTQPVKSPSPAKVNAWEGTPVVLATINTSLKDPEELVHLAAVRGAETAHDTNALATLITMFSRETGAPVKQAIIEAAGSMKNSEATKFIRSLLEAPSLAPALLTTAVKAFEKNGAKELIPAVIALVEKGSAVTVRQSAIEALGTVKSADAIPALARAAKGPEADQHSAIAALGRIGGDSGVQTLASLLKEEDPAVRREAVIALGTTKNKSAVEPLLAAWHDGATRPDAIIALAQRADIRALDAYVDGIGDKNSSVRDAARRGLERVQNEALAELERRAKEGSLSGVALAGVQKVYERNDKAKVGPIFAHSSAARSTDPAVYASFAMKNGGNRRNGKIVFADMKGAACIKCHKAEGQGGEVGPDLNSAGAKYNRTQIIEHILYPSRIILDGYQQTTVFTKDGETQNGIVRGETPEELTLVDTEGKKHVIAKKQIDTRKQNELSLMPEGLQLGLSVQEFADLVSYVESLKDQPVQALGK